MKKIVLFTFAALVCVSAFVILNDSADADTEVKDDSGSCGSGVTYEFDSGTGTLTIRGSGAVSGYGYNTMPWYSYREFIKTAVIEKSVSSINGNAFYGCTALTSVTIPDSVITINPYAFCGCTALTSVTIPDSVMTLGGSAFSGCSSLTTVTVAESNPFYCSVDGVLFNKSKTELILYPAGKSNTTYILPDSVTAVGDYAFESCTSLTFEIIPDSVTTVGDYAFFNCTSLSFVTIPDSVVALSVSTFYGCTSLISVTVADNNPCYCSVDGVLFNKSKSKLILYPAGKSDISYILPDTVTTIGNSAFYGCNALTSVTISDSVTTIGNSSFSCCDRLFEVINLSSLTDVKNGNYGFDYVNNFFTSVSDANVKADGNGFVYGKSEGVYYLIRYIGKETEIALSDKLDDSGYVIRDYAFEDCAALTSVTIPDSVTSIGSQIFRGCISLTSVTIADGNSNYCSVDGVLFNKSKSKLILYPAGKFDTLYSIPNSVVSIGNYAFSDCTSLAFATIPNSVISIGHCAFSDCTSLTSVTLGNSVTSVGSSAFSDCISLTSVTLGNSVTSIGSAAFFECASLRSVNIPDSVMALGNHVFGGCTSLTSITIPDSISSIGEWAFQGCISLTSITIPDSINSIGQGAFSGCTSLTAITIPNSVTSIGFGTFTGCIKLKSISIPSSVTSIDSETFYGLRFYDLNGTDKLETTAEKLAGYIFRGSDGKLVKQNTLKMTLVLGEGRTSEVLFVGGDAAIKPADPKRVGHTFLYWRCGDTAYVFPETMPAESLTLTAIWMINQYTISFDTDGGSAVNTILQLYNTPVIAPANPTKTGYTFQYWTEDGSNVYIMPEKIPAENISLKAVWRVNQYTISFDTDGGNVVSKIKKNFGSELSAPDTPIKSECTFRYWTKDGNTAYVFPKTMPAESFTLTAVWGINKYVVTFDVGGKITSGSYNYGTAVKDILPKNPSKDADAKYTYVFLGWNGYTEGMTVTENLTIEAEFLAQEVSSAYVISSEGETTIVASSILEKAKKSAVTDTTAVLKVIVGKSTVVFDSAALQKISAGELKVTELSEKEKKAMKGEIGDSPVYSITFGTNTSFGNGTAAVTVPYSLKSGQDSKNLEVWYMVGGKAADKLSAEYENGYVTFTTGHFSNYAIVYVESEEEGSSVLMIAIIAIIAVVAIAGAVVVKKRKV